MGDRASLVPRIPSRLLTSAHNGWWGPLLVKRKPRSGESELWQGRESDDSKVFIWATVQHLVELKTPWMCVCAFEWGWIFNHCQISQYCFKFCVHSLLYHTSTIYDKCNLINSMQCLSFSFTLPSHLSLIGFPTICVLTLPGWWSRKRWSVGSNAAVQIPGPGVWVW